MGTGRERQCARNQYLPSDHFTNEERQRAGVNLLGVWRTKVWKKEGTGVSDYVGIKTVVPAQAGTHTTCAILTRQA
jgi:hypothetical protein